MNTLIKICLRYQQAKVSKLLRTEEFLPGTSLLLNAQRKNTKNLHEGGSDQYLCTSIYLRIGKYSGQTHVNL